MAELAGTHDAGARWEITRRGQRAEIPWLLRLGVYRRDGFTCAGCGRRYEADGLNLDHIVPWSAGGSDDTSNVRVLCWGCNQRRSNHRDGATPRRPVTWWCHGCWDPGTFTERPLWRDGTDLMAVPLLTGGPDERDVLAYCAWCDATDWTRLPLEGVAALLLPLLCEPADALAVDR